MKPSPTTVPPELQKLFEGLAAGDDQKLFTVDDWATRLGEDDLAQEFIRQMRQEWQPLTMPDGLCQEMLDYARSYLGWYLGWPIVWAHILRVTGNALVLAPEAGVDPAHAFMLGIFHDIGKLDEAGGGEAHEEIGGQMLIDKLTDHYTRAEVILLSNVIAKKSSGSNPYTKLLHDADKLDKIGATGLARRLSTRWGTEHVRYALGRVKDELLDFPEMHFRTSSRLSDLKQAFTEDFLQRAKI